MWIFVKKTINFTQEQVDYLGKLQTISLTEHIRRAVDDYIKKLKQIDSSSSLSKRKEKL